MEGDAERRFCGVCQKHVHNLSAMAMADAQALLQDQGANHLCVRYSSAPDGSLRFRDLVPTSSLLRRVVRASVVAAFVAGCAPHGDAPVRGLGEAIIESVRTATVPSDDGGCTYATGAFTTIHFPPGHVLCTGPGLVASPTEPVLPDGPVMGGMELEPPPEPEMGAMEPYDPPPPVPDPMPVPKMGEAMIDPGSADAFVPCDKPQFAPPPPPGTPADDPGELMGKMEIEPPAPPPAKQPKKPSKPALEVTEMGYL